MLSPSLPEYCTPTNDLLIDISSYFHTCVPTPLALLSTLLGVLSIVSWLFAQLPQIFKNYKSKSASGLSIYFLIEWLLGDVTNLFGALLTSQASWQVVVAGYYVCVDVCLVWQYIWYAKVKLQCEARPHGFEPENNRGGQGSEDVLVGISPSDGTSTPSSTSGEEGKKSTGVSQPPTKPQEIRNDSGWMSNFSFSGEEKSTQSSSSSRTIHRYQTAPAFSTPSPRTLLLISLLCAVLSNASPLHPTPPPTPSPLTPDSTESFGRILSWTSTMLYLGSRLPQLYKNYVRASTAGLSPTLFIAAFFGNLFYSSSLLTNPLAWSSFPPHGLHGWVGSGGSEVKTWRSLAAPFWLGAAGVLVLDAAVGIQFLIFEECGVEKAVAVEDERGRGRWKRVGGWMRGWVPSRGASPATREEGEEGEDERLLIGREGSREGYGGI